MPIIQKDVAKALIPLISINVLGLGVNTLCLVYVDTSFYQVIVNCISLVQLFILVWSQRTKSPGSKELAGTIMN